MGKRVLAVLLVIAVAFLLIGIFDPRLGNEIVNWIADALKRLVGAADS